MPYESKFIDDLVEDTTEKFDVRKQVSNFAREWGKWLALSMMSLIPFLFTIGADPAKVMMITIGSFAFFFFTILALVIRYFSIKLRQAKTDLVGLAKSQVEMGKKYDIELLGIETKLGNRLRNLENHSVDAIVEIDLNTVKYLRVNKAFVDRFGYTSAQLNAIMEVSSPRAVNEMLYHPDSVEIINDVTMRRLTGDYTEPVDLKLWMKTKEDQYIPIRYRSNVVKVNGSYISQIFITDLTLPEDMRATIVAQKQLIDDLLLKFVHFQCEKEEAKKIVDLMKTLGSEIANVK
jgi:hypothetical protein